MERRNYDDEKANEERKVAHILPVVALVIIFGSLLMIAILQTIQQYKLKFNGGVNSMKIYTLYHDESSKEAVVCVSENVEKIKKIYLKCAKIKHFLIWKYGKMEI